ncbi:hypothetical protein BC829DRAFT_403993 [Chytridium lagenaria]|nr:hypothetical protein BC829DRAFT_403993 [Chytridium lagenaria]
MVYVDIVFSANTHRDEFIDRLRKIYLRILYFPIAIVFGLFIYQGYLSDLYHYGREDGKGGYTIRPRDDDTTSLFTRIQFINTVLWLLCFLVLLIFVIIGRSSFSRYMRDVVEPELQKENERWAVTSGNITLSSSSSPNKFSSSTSEHKKQPRSHMRELSSTLKSSIWTMKWIAWALGLFLLYSIFFAIVVLFLEESVGIYYATLAVNWWSPTGFGVYQKWRQVRRAKRDLWDEISEASGNGVGMEARNISSYTA